MVVVALIVVSVLAILAQGDLFRKPLIHQLSIRLGQRIDFISLLIDLLTTTPEMSFTGLRVGEPAWDGPGDMVLIPVGTVHFGWTSLLGGQVAIAAIRLDHPSVRLHRDAQVRANWRFAHLPAKLPALRDIVIVDGRVIVEDAVNRVRLAGRVAVGGPGVERGYLQAAAWGTLVGQNLSLRAIGAPPSSNDIFPIALAATLGNTLFGARLRLAAPLKSAHFDGIIATSGRNLAQLSDVAHSTLPATGPYRLAAKIHHDDIGYALKDISGTLGRSDLEGSVSISKVAGRTHLSADLTSPGAGVFRSMELDRRAPGGTDGDSAAEGRESEVACRGSTAIFQRNIAAKADSEFRCQHTLSHGFGTLTRHTTSPTKFRRVARRRHAQSRTAANPLCPRCVHHTRQARCPDQSTDQCR